MADRSFGDFDALARQYWNQWGEMMRSATAPAAPPAPTMPGWDDAIGWWSKLASGGMPEANAAVGRFERQAGDWFGRIQQLAAGFVGRNPAAADVVDAWKQMLGGARANPFGDVLASMGGQGQQGFDQWFEQAAPFISALQGEGRSWLGMPAFGFAREHQERWQRIARLQVEYQERNQACQQLMMEAGQKAFVRFEEKLAAHAEPGRQLTSARALFDVWIDAAEDAYAEVALSPQYRADFGEMVNAQMRLRAALQHEVELVAGLFGMPSRTEIDSAHRKIVQLERELRHLRERADASATADTPAERPTVRKSSTQAAPGPGGSSGKGAAGASAKARPGTRSSSAKKTAPQASTAARKKPATAKSKASAASRTRASTARAKPGGKAAPARATPARATKRVAANGKATRKGAR
ncbi:class III poly(R)-hydroxyalkanoic acid synthase subunit PhaE [Marilutibacter aestuarii]|uniref:Poly(3-hydroxyalkanoate) polymerase subunit PhaE n=1 Tax=Marilutibacter aestuarii TaxID=1706195 RepID=A0A507ZXG4_9GAMM|nr:class III poly(R)-hydroxyalkanoic acid synthase subunit PhaE [Lysobacter aestuarii]TQD42199.1 class III poly(R)-hydroxyalkanoic acid synthase subunit PhaE [Lysobacter aestuarii]